MHSIVSRCRAIPAFSLIELVIVVVIVGIIAAIAVPRLSRGAEGARERALVHDLDAMRKALALYEAEHAGSRPATAMSLSDALTKFTAIDGSVSTTKDTTHIYGPYLRAIPILQVGANRGSNAFQDVGAPGTGSEGWSYDPSTGTIRANTADSEVDALGKAYNTY